MTSDGGLSPKNRRTGACPEGLLFADILDEEPVMISNVRCLSGRPPFLPQSTKVLLLMVLPSRSKLELPYSCCL